MAHIKKMGVTSEKNILCPCGAASVSTDLFQ